MLESASAEPRCHVKWPGDPVSLLSPPRRPKMWAIRGRALVSRRSVRSALATTNSTPFFSNSARQSCAAVGRRLYGFQTVGVAGGIAALAAASSSLTLTPMQGRAAMCSEASPSAATNSLKPAAHIDDVDIVLFQYAICPFCNKVKAVLDFYGLRYRTVEVNPINKVELKDTSVLQTDYRKVPVATINGEVIVDSPVILRRVLDLLEDNGIATVAQGDDDGISSEWIQWVDKSLAVLLFPNITRNFSESWQAFGYISDVDSFSAMQRGLNRVLGPVAMWAAQGKIKKKYDIDDERAALFDALYTWADTIDASACKFHGGDSPSIADLCVFGCIRAIDGLDTHAEVVSDPRINSWYNSMVAAVGTSSNINKSGNSY